MSLREDNAVSGHVAQDAWHARAELYELAALGLLPTTAAFAEALASGAYAEACGEAAAEAGLQGGPEVSLLAQYADGDPAAVFHELRRERTRLFVGERKPLITPYAGVRQAEAQGQRPVLMVGKESMAIERFMRRCGVAKDLAAGNTNDPIDHVGTMCEFMQYLCLVAARAIEPPAGAEVSEADAVAFREEHFAPYALWCAERLRAEARTPYYRFLPSLLDFLS